MKTYWTYEILCLSDAKKRSLVIAPADTLHEALAGAFKDATYYMGICHYKIAVVFHESCANCQGTGVKVKGTKRSRHTVPCSVCKGKPIQREIPETPWIANDSVALHDVYELCEAIERDD